MKQLAARARAEETIYANRRQEEFIVHARSLRRLGEWAAENMLGKDAEHVANYAEALVKSSIAGSDPFQSVANDLREAGVEHAEMSVSARFEKFLDEARRNAKL